MFKRLFAVLILILSLCFNIFAESIEIEHADTLYNEDKIYVLKGNVKLSFTSDNGDKSSLNADKISIDLEEKVLEASGNVVLIQDREEKSFEGSAIVLYWDSVDLIVFDGQSSIDRTNTKGTSVNFIISGDSISYANESGGVFFNNGTIATSKEDPYWSISSKKMSFSGNDLFINDAWFRLGRVPIFYFPVFFYPGTTFTFNPSIGLSSSKGAFFNTTTELYGVYPKLGDRNSSNSSDEEGVANSIFAMMNSKDDRNLVSAGLYYRELESDESLNPFETWARESNSYFAVFADVYENLGLMMGYDTQNNIGKSLKIVSTGLVGYNNQADINLPKLRTAFDLDLSYSNNGLKVSAKLPYLSDPFAKRDFLNRNTSFGLDAIFGSEQKFPSSFSEVKSYTWALDASYSKNIGAFSFNLSSLKADIDYKLVKDTKDGRGFYQHTITEASLPYINFSSKGTFFDLKGKDSTTVVSYGYTNVLAQELETERNSLEFDDLEELEGSDISLYKGPNITTEKSTTVKGSSLKSGYTFNQSFDNRYLENFIQDNYYTKINGSVYVSANAPDSWFSVTETVKPSFNFANNDMSKLSCNQVNDFKLNSELLASIPKIGLTYKLNTKVYSYYSKQTSSSFDSKQGFGEWKKEDVTAHSLTYSQNVGLFTFGLALQFKPLTENIKPLVSFKYKGFSANADFTMEKKALIYEKGIANLNASYSNSYLSFSIANRYDFLKSQHLKITQKASIKPFSGLTLMQDAVLLDRFALESFNIRALYACDTASFKLDSDVSMSFKDKTFNKESLSVKLALSTQKISLWKNRIGIQTKANLKFDYHFDNPYRSLFSFDFAFDFAVAEFVDLSFKVSSSNKNFSKYYDGDVFVLSKMLDDLAKSFDFFGDGRRSTGFNMNSISLQMIHYMKDWNLCIDVSGNLTTKYSSKYEWVPQVTVYVKWNALPELKTEGNWDASNKEWH